MANSYTQLYIHYVFAPKHRLNLFPISHKEEIHKYIGGIIKSQKGKPLAINSMSDHTHVLLGLHPTISVAKCIQSIKSRSSGFINQKSWLKGEFEWQSGYGAFSHSRSQIDAVIKYIENQEIHHQKKSFMEEYIEMLKKFGVIYEEKYLFD